MMSRKMVNTISASVLAVALLASVSTMRTAAQSEFTGGQGFPYGAFDRLPAGDKYRLYLHDADTFHMLFELKASECGTSKDVDRSKCDEIVRWVSSVALAFLDANLKADALAGQWLGSSNVVNASGGVAEWTRK